MPNLISRNKKPILLLHSEDELRYWSNR